MNGVAPQDAWTVPEPLVSAPRRVTRDPLEVRPEEVRRSVQAKSQALMVQRFRAGLLLALASYVLFLAVDVLGEHRHLTSLLAIKILQFGVVGGLFLFCRHPRIVRHIVGVAVGTTVFVAVAATASTILRGDSGGHLLLLVALTIVTATMYPWGTRAQGVVVAVGLILFCLNVYAVNGTLFALLTQPSLSGLITAEIISLYIAYDGDRYRWQIEEQELNLRLREEYFRSLIENGTDLIAVTTADGTVLSASASVQRLLGYPTEDLPGAAVFEFLHPEDVPILRDLLRASAEGAAPQPPVEVRVRDVHSAWHVLLVSLANLSANPAVNGFVFNARDITLRKEAETELRRSEAALSALIESTEDAVWSVDRDCRLTAMNTATRRSFAEVYGVDLHLGQSLEARAPQALAPERRRLYERVFAGERVTTEQRVERGGGIRHYLVSMNPIRDGDTISGAVVLSRDITELRQTAELARRNQADLTHVLRLGTMGEIASGLAHEINQPLGAISNYAAACGRWLESGEGSPQDLRRGLELISIEALRAGAIIRRLRELARKGDESMQVVDLGEVVRSAVVLLEPETRLQGITLELAMAEDLPPLQVDPIQIEQVILNLVLNALEAMQASRVKHLSISTARVDGHVRVAVRDSGSGLETTLADRVFDPFFTTKPTGLGMGLAISRRIVEAHGGQLSAAANECGVGSVFAFTLPLSEG